MIIKGWESLILYVSHCLKRHPAAGILRTRLAVFDPGISTLSRNVEAIELVIFNYGFIEKSLKQLTEYRF